MKAMEFATPATKAVTSGGTTVLEVELPPAEDPQDRVVEAEIKNLAGGGALTVFDVYVQGNTHAAFYGYLGDDDFQPDGDGNNLNKNIPWMPATAPKTLASGSIVNVQFYVRATCRKIQFRMTSASTSNVQIRGSVM